MVLGFTTGELPYAQLLGIAYLLCMNLATLICFLVDKARAAGHNSRISEATLLGLALSGGSLGALLGMHLVRHKTQKWYFKFTVPVMLVAQVVLIWWLCHTGFFDVA
ncbi:DUF1294 domain-containing protein [Paratractidigestivibacter sp.]|uniref:DUF1294 domain-containing protein n=1 Tax=Paratractidigestivibacter sp. TaxID=2847316 RepID=UPI002ABEA185|nr:DUF1294 domain-containing protein [Paratractidigestivibacter sp.]